MGIDAVIFDLDDTLISEREYAMSGFRAVGEWLKGRTGTERFFETAVAFYHSSDKSRIFNRSLDVLGVPYDDGVIADCVACYREHRPDIQLLPDAEWALSRLEGRVKLGLITDGYLETQERKVQALSLRDRMEAVILTDLFGRDNWKPSPVPYEAVSHMLQAPHSRCLYIGDNPAKDFITANRLGWMTVHIDRGEGVYSGSRYTPDHEAHYRIARLQELRDIPVLRPLFRMEGLYA
ncbi:HAD family hydrolase [Gorillibacterium timonense]|uniref:HAD family hydrolase n=1 Tax=Gorillibacterium timonense TaxID=1689269 RepID=UPI00071D46C4|nr:HAD family hydrolase [Gorillibacterium timonense]